MDLRSFLLVTRSIPLVTELKLSAATGEATTLVIPPTTRPGTMHVILELRDNGTPNLRAYRRAVITVAASAKP